MFSVNIQKCRGCGLCVEACPRGAIRVIEGKAQIGPALCAGCGLCAQVCPQGAIQATVPTGWGAYSPSRPAPSGVRQQLRDLRARTEALQREMDQLMERFRKLEKAERKGIGRSSES